METKVSASSGNNTGAVYPHDGNEPNNREMIAFLFRSLKSLLAASSMTDVVWAKGEAARIFTVRLRGWVG
jgi:hypothetical protein